ncbi:MAG: hypothetical protein AB7S97_00350 [Thermoplasmata archaeon]
MKAAELGRLDPAQTDVLLHLASRVGLLGFENDKVVSAMVTEIALEVSAGKRMKLARKLRRQLEGDGLLKDLVPVLCGAFSLD